MKLFLLLSFVLAFGQLEDEQLIFEDQDSFVTTNFGTIRGTAFERFRQFLGVPYAAPPIGELRWQAPQDPESWDGVLVTQNFQPACPQTPSDAISNRYSEDCLYLNIWAPLKGVKPPEGGFPVEMWIHGGAYDTGSATHRRGMEQGQFVVGRRQDVITITTTHRLGAIGYMCAEPLKERSFDGSAGTYGVRDTRKALEWIQNNIKYFNGNPEKVMLVGRSGGGLHIANHLTLLESDEFFQSAIMQSGSFSTRTARDLPSLTRNFEEVSENVNCFGTPQAKLDCLLRTPWQSIVNVQFNVSYEWEPCIDGVMYTRHPTEIVQSGDANKKPVVLGTNKDDGRLMCAGLDPMRVDTPEHYFEYLEDRFTPILAPTVAELYPFFGFPSGFDAASRISGDLYTSCAARRSADWLSRQGIPTWLYIDDIETEITPNGGVVHGAEDQLVWERLDYFPLSLNTPRAIFDIRAREIVDYWRTMADTGNPNHEGATFWPEFNITDSTDGDLTFHWDVSGLFPENEFKKIQCDFWARHLEFDGMSSPCVI